MNTFTRYFLVGGTAGLVDLILFILLINLNLHWLLAASVSFITATLVNYILSIRHVFKSGIRFKKDHEIALVFIVSLIGLFINSAVLGLLISYNLFPIWFSKVIATGTVFVWNFIIRHYFVFKGST